MPTQDNTNLKMKNSHLLFLSLPLIIHILLEAENPSFLLHPDLKAPLLHLPAPDRDARPHHIAHAHTPDPLGRPRQHHIARLKRHDPRHMAQDGGDGEQHQAGGIPLAGLAVDGQEQLHVIAAAAAAAVRIRGDGEAGKAGEGRQGGFGDALAEGEEGVEAFGGGPGETVLFGHGLRVARRHVDRHGVG